MKSTGPEPAARPAPSAFFTSAAVLVCGAAAALAFSLPVPTALFPPPPVEASGFDWPALKAGCRGRIEASLARGRLPLFDVESSYGPPSGDPEREGDWLARVRELTALADEGEVAVIAFSPGPGRYRELGARSAAPAWAEANRALAGSALPWFLPVPAAGNLAGPGGAAYAREILAEARRGRYPLLGEYFFRHYPSNAQLAGPSAGSGDWEVPLDGPAGDELFAYAERYGVPFQIHYEPENRLFPALERQLRKYPGARVIWAHFGRARYPQRASGYTAAWLQELIEKYPNLYFDTSGSGPGNRYKATGALTSLLWDRRTGRLAPEWKALIERYPWRFLCALDLGSERSDTEGFRRTVGAQRLLLSQLSPEAAPIVAYKAAWKLIFNEEF